MTTEQKVIEEIDKKYMYLHNLRDEVCVKNGINPMDIFSFDKQKEIPEIVEIIEAQEVLRLAKDRIKNEFKSINETFDKYMWDYNK